MNRPSPCATITIVRVPVWITASLGTNSASRAAAPLRRTVANMPGTSCPAGLASSMRALRVRVAPPTSGKIAATCPFNTVPGKAGVRASTGLPRRTCDARFSGTSALTQTLVIPLMRNSGAPAMTVMPSRAPSSVITPACGAAIVKRTLVLPLAETAVICSSLMPTRRMRWRAASSKPSVPAPAMRLIDRYSSWAAIHSGTYSSASACPLRTGSRAARTYSRSTKPLLRAWTTATSRSL